MNTTWLSSKTGGRVTKRVLSCVVLLALLFLFAPTSLATITTSLGGKPFVVQGYINQGVQFGLQDEDVYDTQEGFQQFILQILLEMQLELNPQCRFYVSGKWNQDWAYDLLHDNSEWTSKEFNESRDNLYVLDDWESLLSEAHITWTPGNFNFRIGKQIVKWGETDGFRIMDQVNPLDQRRGLADVEFESTIVPIPLVKAEYYMQPQSSWLQDLAFEFVFNPNAKFIPNKGIALGNDVGGIWNPRIDLGPGITLGSSIADIDEPGHFDDHGFGYAFRIKSILHDALITLNYYYGLDHDPVTQTVGTTFTASPFDGRTLVHLVQTGYFPLFRFFGFTFSKDIEALMTRRLGGVAPVVRLEAFYAYDNTFATAINSFDQLDEIRWALAVDQKVKINFLNDRDYFAFTGQFYQRKIMNYPHEFDVTSAGATLRPDNYTMTLMCYTRYYHEKITPLAFWMRDITNRADMLKVQITYDHDPNWHFNLGGVWFRGSERGNSFEVFDHKDNLYFTVAYKF